MTQEDAPSPLMLFRPLALLVGAVTTAAVVLWLAMPAADTRKARLGQVESWTYQLQNLAPSRAAIADSNSDMLVIDYAIDRGEGLKPLGRKFVERQAQAGRGQAARHRLFLGGRGGRVPPLLAGRVAGGAA